MRIIIDNDKYNLYARTDYALTANTLTASKSSVGQGTLEIINPAGFTDLDYIIIENIEDERAELIKITSISGNIFTLATNLLFDHDNKTKVHRLAYNQIKFYEDEVIKATVDIEPDYFAQTQIVIDEDKEYSIAYYNSEDSVETPRGEIINGWEYNLCSIGDLIQYETQEILGNKSIDKINLASRETVNSFISQDQKFTDLSTRDIARLREPVALRALYYIFNELIKNENDTASLKAKNYLNLYKAKNIEVMDVITKQNDDIRIFGQTRAIR